MPHPPETPDRVAELSNKQIDRVRNLSNVIGHWEALAGHLHTRVLLDQTGGGSDKILTVPEDKLWRLISARVTIITDATVGTRHMQVDIRTPAPVVYASTFVGLTIAASATFQFCFAPGYMREFATVTPFFHYPLPADLWMPERHSIRFFDSNTISAAGDNILVALAVQEITA